MKIACFHLYSDYSGSPKVLHDVLMGLRERGVDIELTTSTGGVLGQLSERGINCHHYRYTFSPNPVVTMLRYVWIQLYTFFTAFRYIGRRNTVFYINTILPVGPAIAARLMGKRIVYHYHENAFIKGRFYRTLAWAMQRLADKIICVSAYQTSALKSKDKVAVVPNTLSAEFISKLYPDAEAAFRRRNILMLSSLKEYKGTKEFIELAREMPHLRFTLVINDTQTEIDRWMACNDIIKPYNTSIFPRTSDVSLFYNDASVVLNLSNPRLFIETFGLTAIEAMSCALPVIVPAEGGIAELVTDGEVGYKIDCLDKRHLAETIDMLLSDKNRYMKMAQNALDFSRKFSRENMINSIITLLKQCYE